ncbi:MAG: hypothetical protein J2O49_10750, partial [Sciscionella sp.]|nr:hypothetical protein [Sciscionella sp.]
MCTLLPTSPPLPLVRHTHSTFSIPLVDSAREFRSILEYDGVTRKQNLTTSKLLIVERWRQGRRL